MTAKGENCKGSILILSIRRFEIELLYQNLCSIIHNTKKASNSYCNKSDRPNFFLVEWLIIFGDVLSLNSEYQLTRQKVFYDLFRSPRKMLCSPYVHLYHKVLSQNLSPWYNLCVWCQYVTLLNPQNRITHEKWRDAGLAKKFPIF